MADAGAATRWQHYDDHLIELLCDIITEAEMELSGQVLKSFVMICKT